MLVYGDQKRTIEPARTLAELAKENGAFLTHDQLRNRFLLLAELTQAVADVDLETCGVDRIRPTEEALLSQLVAHGAALITSYDANCSGGVAPPVAPVPDLPQRAVAKLSEGYAFYALYPEAFGLAARMLQLEAPQRVIGLRSIGTGLSAIAAAALGSAPPVTLRPSGDPFARSLRLHPQLAERLLEGEAHFVIVDEGPGLSGSSFGGVADWLEERGVPSHRIAFLPGHEGALGPKASEQHARRWKVAQRPVARIDRLRGWIEQLVGPISQWDEFSGGAWRPHWSASKEDWPAVTPMWERAKSRVQASSGWWLVRFAGLGSAGEEKLALARQLEQAGFGPEVAGLTNGWLIQRWHEEARPTRPQLDELIAYLRLRAQLTAEPGASLSELVTMVRRNAPGFGSWDPPIESLEARSRPVRIDGRLQEHEWLRLPGGRLLKADALDHHQAHDLVGCQDLAWDVAGAAVELALSDTDVACLEQALGIDPELTAFHRIAYAAFRLGAHRMSEAIVDKEEAARHRRDARHYELALVDSVKHPGDIDQPLGLRVEAGA